MKKFQLTAVAALVFAATAFAQTSVKLQMSHTLGTDAFVFGQTATNDLGHSFQLTRCEYYLSGFQLIHDGGQELLLEDTYALVDAVGTTEIDLGQHNVTTIEALRFSTGVDEAKNHGDPAAYPVTHPLGPKFPSMHWGWAAGYRFLAAEGKSGTNLSYDMQIHALGDKHYYMVELPMNLTAANGEIVLPVNADMAKIFDGISISAGLIEHSDKDEAAEAMQNMRDHVFTSGNTSNSAEVSAVQSFSIFPNPSTTGGATIALDLEGAASDFQVRVSDVYGKQVFLSEAQRGDLNEYVELPVPGIYFVLVIKNGKAVLTEKLLVKQ